MKRYVCLLSLCLSLAVHADPQSDGRAVGEVAASYALTQGAYTALRDAGWSPVWAHVVSGTVVFAAASAYTSPGRAVAGIGVSISVTEVFR
jgi:hypothetical protein